MTGFRWTVTQLLLQVMTEFGIHVLHLASLDYLLRFVLSALFMETSLGLTDVCYWTFDCAVGTSWMRKNEILSCLQKEEYGNTSCLVSVV